MKILYATDGADKQETAAQILIALRLPNDTEITVLSVIEPLHYWVTPPVPPAYHAQWLKAEHEMRLQSEDVVHAAIERSSAAFHATGLTTKPMVRTGQASEEILRTAEETKADIVVVGSRGLSGMHIFLLGSVSQKMIEYAPCSVLVVKQPKKSKPAAIKKVLLATDGSEYAYAAAMLLSTFKFQTDVEIILLNVRNHPSWSARSEELEQMRLAYAEHAITSTLDCLTSEAKTSVVVREGDPSEQIISTASEMSADLIVVGSRGLSGVKRFLLGSVSQRVCYHSDKPVIVVRKRGL